MAKDVVVEIPETELLQQPAARAWRRVAPEFRKPARITILKETRHSAVYRLHAAGPEGRSVVAKRCKPSAAAMERAIYEDILPTLPVPALRFYGLLQEDGESADDQRCWLFIEDAGHEKYSYLLGEHRAFPGHGAVPGGADRHRDCVDNLQYRCRVLPVGPLPVHPA